MNKPITGDELIKKLEQEGVAIDMTFAELDAAQMPAETKMAIANARQMKIRREYVENKKTPKMLKEHFEFLLGMLELQQKTITALSQNVKRAKVVIENREEALKGAANYIAQLEQQLHGTQEEQKPGLVLASEDDMRSELAIRRQAGALTPAEKKAAGR